MKIRNGLLALAVSLVAVQAGAQTPAAKSAPKAAPKAAAAKTETRQGGKTAAQLAPGQNCHFVTWEHAQAAAGKAEVAIAKQRHGPTGTAYLKFDGALTRFTDAPPPAAARSGVRYSATEAA